MKRKYHKYAYPYRQNENVLHVVSTGFFFVSKGKSVGVHAE